MSTEIAGRLDGKVAIVTGGGARGDVPGTGQAISELFAREGASVVIVDRDGEAAARTSAAIKTRGHTATVVVEDIGQEDGCKEVVDQAVDQFGRVDILVNNVGVDNRSGSPRVHEIKSSDWDRLMDVNVKGALMLAKHSIPHMPPGGAVVHISSTDALRPGPDVVYTAAKGALEALSLAIAAQYGDRQIRSNVVRPGEIWTTLVASSFAEQDREIVREKRAKRSLLQTEGTAQDIARAALFLASDEARWITGQAITVDGGLTLHFDRSYHPRVHWEFDHR